jgi:hypothetical protein
MGAASFSSSSSSCILTRAEWTPFQTHCYSENLVAPGIEPGTSGSPKIQSFVWRDDNNGVSETYIQPIPGLLFFSEKFVDFFELACQTT